MLKARLTIHNEGYCQDQGVKISTHVTVKVFHENVLVYS
jgi:hypothetical protein